MTVSSRRNSGWRTTKWERIGIRSGTRKAQKRFFTGSAATLFQALRRRKQIIVSGDTVKLGSGTNTFAAGNNGKSLYSLGLGHFGRLEYFFHFQQRIYFYHRLMAAGLSAKGAIFRAAAGDGVDYGAEFYLVAQQGVPDHVGPGHQKEDFFRRFYGHQPQRLIPGQTRR